MTELRKRTATQRPQQIHPNLMQLKVARELVYRVVNERGPIDEHVFSHPDHALLWGHSRRIGGLWWAEARIGVE